MLVENPISATDILPNLYDEEDEVIKEDRTDDLSYDIYNLTSCSYHALKISNEAEIDETLIVASTRATQLLINRIFECPTEPSPVGPVAVLPPSSTLFRLPREKRIPEPKPETKWQKFAREKNIKNKKKDRMIFDEVDQEFKPRWGYKRANAGIEEHAVVEVKAGQDPFKDPWAEARSDKKVRVQKNEKRHMQNLLRNKDGKIVKKPFDPSTTPGIPLDIANKEGGKRGKDGVRRALQLVQHSTASMGRFDEKRKGEPEKKIRGKKRSFRDNLSSTSLTNEKVAMKSQLRIVADKIEKKAKGVTNSLAAYEGILPDAPSDSFKQKKGKGKSPSNSSSGGQPPKKKTKH